MKPVSAKILLVAIALSGGFPSLSLRADPPPARSPFQPEGTGGPAPSAPTLGAPLELRGIVSTSSGYLYGIFDPTKRQSAWVRMNDAGNDFAVRSHDVGNDTVTVEYQGRTMTLALKTAKVESMAPLPNPAQVNIQRGANPMPNQPMQPQPQSLTPSAADEARRLEGVAAEVRRRRMLRQAAMQNGAQQPQPQQGQNGGQPPMRQPPMPQPTPGGQPLPR